ncbi:Serine/threonine protein kinase [Penicillium brevicompactum]|uniref:non-specific serine/threonine protein kinase n=1 Tax=Penicillium brevicompactum TaxID=5074 RepID=A0A9W9QXH1_PENBR|nr:Serine/threonine protein kinase [Penicillium brevicompactum]
MAAVDDPTHSSPTSPPAVATSPEQDIEEGKDVYRAGGFHPVYIGDVYNNRDGDLCKYLALKILSAESYGTEHHIFEREILQHLRDGDPKQFGYDQICHLVDDFEHQGPNGLHVCLVFDLIGETLESFQAWFPEGHIPNQVMRRITIQMLLALDYAHDHNVIHTEIWIYTDIQPSNIFVKIRDASLIKSGYLTQVPVPQQDKTKQYSAIPSTPLRQYYFNNSDRFDHFDFTLGDWGVSSWIDRHLTETIEPVALRSPEVLIRAPWNETTDLWNLGALLLECFCAVRMFIGAVPPDGHYEIKQHLAEIVHLFGPLPKTLIEKGDQDLVQSIFDDDGMHRDPIPANTPGLSSEHFTPGLDTRVREKFVSFLSTLMRTNPTERPSPEDLLRHPWLGALK